MNIDLDTLTADNLIMKTELNPELVQKALTNQQLYLEYKDRAIEILEHLCPHISIHDLSGAITCLVHKLSKQE